MLKRLKKHILFKSSISSLRDFTPGSRPQSPPPMGGGCYEGVATATHLTIFVEAIFISEFRFHTYFRNFPSPLLSGTLSILLCPRSRTAVETLCRNKYNATGMCSYRACPLANSQYATVLEKEGTMYLNIKTIERAHLPKKLWEAIELSKNTKEALDQVLHVLVSDAVEGLPKKGGGRWVFFCFAGPIIGAPMIIDIFNFPPRI